MRGQANLVEYSPFALILMLLAELQGGFSLILALLAALFVIGRTMHGYAMGFTENSPTGRYYGIQLTLWPLLALMLLNIWLLVSASGQEGT